jgi:uncharacterized protein YdiU (UPF0061 family)
VIERQAELIAHWMQLGFIHGVMNTDNMTVSGETIDYGPCAFIDNYNPAKTFSSIDHQGRYAYANQGPIALWNLTRLAETLLPLLDVDEEKSVEVAKSALDRFAGLHETAIQERFLAKIGIQSGTADDWSMVETLLAVMADGDADFTLVFRHLAGSLESGNDDAVMRLFHHPEAIGQWLSDWRDRLNDVDHTEVIALMRRTNPIFIPRNHRVEEAIRAGYEGNFDPFHRINQVLQNPFTEQAEFNEYEAAPAPHEVVQATFCGT